MHAGNEVTYLPSIGIHEGGVVKEGRTVRLTLDLDLSSARIRTQHTVALTPVLVSADGSREVEFPAVVIDGRTRSKVYYRAQHLPSVDLPIYHDGDAQVIIRRKNGHEQRYDYSATVPYERWMLNGQVGIREEVHGCVNCGEGSSEQTVWRDVLPAYLPTYRLDTIAPELEPIKVRSETRTARLQFRQAKYDIDPDYKDNRAELATVTQSVDAVKNDPDLGIKGIYITGYASPEGTAEFNQRLSLKRAEALATRVQQDTNVDASLWHVTGLGEDWEGLRREVENHPMLLKRDEVLQIIDECGADQDACERRLKALDPPEIYNRLLNEMYAPLRRNEYRIEYDVRNFDLEEARRMIDERPDLLSLTEMYQVAESYGEGSPQYHQVMATAVRYFPDSPALLNDNALDAIARGEYDEAVRLLEPSEVTARTPALLNTLGVAYAELGEYDKAEDAFSRASEAGSTTARHNLAEVQQVMAQL